jgi:hypothetical protein
MKIAMIICSLVLAVMVLISATAKLRKVPQVVEGMAHVGVGEAQLPLLATLEILGGVGLLVGFGLTFLGQIAAVGVALYFAGALVAHIRKRDGFTLFAPAFLLFVLAAITVGLQFNRS